MLEIIVRFDHSIVESFFKMYVTSGNIWEQPQTLISPAFKNCAANYYTCAFCIQECKDSHFVTYEPLNHTALYIFKINTNVVSVCTDCGFVPAVLASCFHLGICSTFVSLQRHFSRFIIHRWLVIDLACLNGQTKRIVILTWCSRAQSFSVVT